MRCGHLFFKLDATFPLDGANQLTLTLLGHAKNRFGKAHGKNKTVFNFLGLDRANLVNGLKYLLCWRMNHNRALGLTIFGTTKIR